MNLYWFCMVLLPTSHLSFNLPALRLSDGAAFWSHKHQVKWGNSGFSVSKLFQLCVDSLREFRWNTKRKARDTKTQHLTLAFYNLKILPLHAHCSEVLGGLRKDRAHCDPTAEQGALRGGMGAKGRWTWASGAGLNSPLPTVCAPSPALLCSPGGMRDVSEARLLLCVQTHGFTPLIWRAVEQTTSLNGEPE